MLLGLLFKKSHANFILFARYKQKSRPVIGRLLLFVYELSLLRLVIFTYTTNVS